MPPIPAQTREGAIELPDGRRLAYIERGAEDGVPVIFHHGTPGSRAGHHPGPGVYTDSGVRAVSYDRAGYGRSDRLPSASFELVPGVGHLLYGAWGEALTWAAG